MLKENVQESMIGRQMYDPQNGIKQVEKFNDLSNVVEDAGKCGRKLKTFSIVRRKNLGC